MNHLNMGDTWVLRRADNPECLNTENTDLVEHFGQNLLNIDTLVD